MIKTVKLILLSILLVTFYSCSSSNKDNPFYVYSNYKNFTAILELSADTVFQGETVCVRLYIKNNSDEIDSIGYINVFNIAGHVLSNSISITGEVADTFTCNEMRIGIIDHGERIGYTVFLPYEEKTFHKFINSRALMCEDSSGNTKWIYRYIYPTTYKISFKLSNYANPEFLQSENSLKLVVKEDSNVVIGMISVDEILHNNRDKTASEAITIIDEYIEKYKNTVFEKEFFLKKLYYMSLTSYPFDESIFKKIENYIDDDPDSPLISSFLFYYNFKKGFVLNDSASVRVYLKRLTEKYKNRSAGIFAKEELEKKY